MEDGYDLRTVQRLLGMRVPSQR
ncbi:MAG: hypothetical protein RLN82_08655 [Pseudomonadales bacterium]